MNTKYIHVHQNDIIYGVRVMVFNATFNNIFKLYRGGKFFVVGGNRSIPGKPPACNCQRQESYLEH